MPALHDKVVLITGASSGIGAATARALAAEGAKVSLVARSGDALGRLASEIGEDHALAVPADVTQAADVERMVRATLDRFGRIDVVFANAGVFIPGKLAEGDPEEWARGIDLNVTAVCRTLRATLPHLIAQKSGHVLLTASVAGRKLFPDQAVYCATKHAVYALAEGVRAEVLEHDIRVTVVAPGFVANEFWGDDISPGVRQALDEERAIASEDIAGAVVYALSQPRRVNVNDILIRPLKQEG